MATSNPGCGELQFDPQNHRYTLNGKILVGVTDMLTAMGLQSHEWATEKDRLRGQAVHRLCTDYIIPGRWSPKGTSEELVPYGKAFMNFLQDTQFKPALVEHQVFSAQYGLAGRLDLWGGSSDPNPWLVDIKSGEPQPAWKLQTALYEFMLDRMMDDPGGGVKRVALRLQPDGRYRMQFSEDPKDLSLALGAVNLYNWRRNNGLIRKEQSNGTTR
jgi:hypothetical protein